MQKINRSFAPAIIWFILLTVLLTLPGSALPKENWFDEVHLDKWVHIGLFFILVILWCLALNKTITSKKRTLVFVSIAVLAIFYGIGMEFVQKYFIPGRSFELMDMGADAIGASIGFIFSYLKFIKK